MLVLTRRVEEAINIGDEILVRVLRIQGDRVKLGIVAPRHISVLREELCAQVREQNRIAAVRATQRGSRARAVKGLLGVANDFADQNS